MSSVCLLLGCGLGVGGHSVELIVLILDTVLKSGGNYQAAMVKMSVFLNV